MDDNGPLLGGTAQRHARATLNTRPTLDSRRFTTTQDPPRTAQNTLHTVEAQSPGTWVCNNTLRHTVRERENTPLDTDPSNVLRGLQYTDEYAFYHCI